MTTTLITGANKGLGLATARQLVAAGHDVFIGARNVAAGQAAAHDAGCRFIEIDVRHDASVNAAARTLEREAGGLDVLVNNAGISGGFVPPQQTTAADMLAVFDTNVFGVVRVTNAFLPLLLQSPSPVIVNVSSGMGSLAVTTDPARFESTLKGLTYPASKASLNMLTSQYAKNFPEARINAVDPGHTATDLNGHRGKQTADDGARIIVAMACAAQDGPTGGFFSSDGPVSW